MNPVDERRKQHCAIWLQSCSRTHALWCDCGIWTSHIRGWSAAIIDPEDENGGAAADNGVGDVVRVDEFGVLVDPSGDPEEDG